MFFSFEYDIDELIGWIKPICTNGTTVYWRRSSLPIVAYSTILPETIGGKNVTGVKEKIETIFYKYISFLLYLAVKIGAGGPELIWDFGK